ncbi:TolC family outer membrane protein [Saccharibacter sp. 17.LH.SD]|uniref:TolC family outer membrane protein n=1 Tax=Saccharibacter sp. 17.LH.SD TaxID=2689393 RepID=UPI0013706F5A|nr:TolC family outer membrane protein [Saccharibacter sp. 17.LH.SD]MXV44435.1 TolC family outer membrane protein [Saccharibacter sp. 17.LH.SD]
MGTEHFYSFKTRWTFPLGIGVGVASSLIPSVSFAQKYDGSGSPNFVPHTLREAMAAAYLTNPQLREERARLRAVDEQMPAAQAGWHPTIQGTLGLTYYKGNSNYTNNTPIGNGQSIAVPNTQRYSSTGYTGGVTLTQPIYQGGKTVANIRMAKNQIMAERARLIAMEQQVLLSVANAYIGVVEDEQLLQISINNERVLRQQLDTANRRFRLGELSRTDVAQAQGALASASAQRQQAEGTLQSAQATYMQQVGIAAPPNLVPPQPLDLPVKEEREAVAMAVHNNPNVVYALFTEAQQKSNISTQMATILPKISAVLGYQHTKDQAAEHSQQDSKYAELLFQVPIYQGGGEYASVRQARQSAESAHHEVDVQRRVALQLASSNWQNYQAYKDSMKSNRIAVKADIAALAGVEREALLGTATTLSVLQQQQTLLLAQQALVQTVASLVSSTYTIASAIGRLTAVDLRLSVPLYDEKAYYKAVKNRLWGISDYAVNEPGR